MSRSVLQPTDLSGSLHRHRPSPIVGGLDCWVAAAVVCEHCVMVVACRAAGAHVHGRLDELGHAVHQTMMGVGGDGMPIHHAQSGVISDRPAWSRP